MAKMVRKQFYIEQRQEDALKQLARDTGSSEAELIRGLIDCSRDSGAFDREAWNALLKDMKARTPTGPGGERRWNRDELYDRPKYLVR